MHRKVVPFCLVSYRSFLFCCCFVRSGLFLFFDLLTNFVRCDSINHFLVGLFCSHLVHKYIPKTSTASADAVAKASSATEPDEKPLSETVAAAKASSKMETSQTSLESLPNGPPALEKAASADGAPAPYSDGYLPPPVKPVDLSRAASAATPTNKGTFGRYQTAKKEVRSPRRSGFFGFKKKRRPNKAAMKKAIQTAMDLGADGIRVKCGVRMPC